MNYNYTACCWFPTSSKLLILPSQFWQNQVWKLLIALFKVLNTGAFTVQYVFPIYFIYIKYWSLFHASFTMRLDWGYSPINPKQESTFIWLPHHSLHSKACVMSAKLIPSPVRNHITHADRMINERDNKINCQTVSACRTVHVSVHRNIMSSGDSLVALCQLCERHTCYYFWIMSLNDWAIIGRLVYAWLPWRKIVFWYIKVGIKTLAVFPIFLCCTHYCQNMYIKAAFLPLSL